MALYRNEFYEAILRKLSFPPNIQPDQLELMLDEAIFEYSFYKPLIKVGDTTGNGGFDYALPSDWVNEFSNIISIEFPYDSSRANPSYMKQQDYNIYRSSSGSVLRLLYVTPSASEVIRINYSTKHTITTTGSTVSETNERHILNYSCALLSETIATEFQKMSRSTLPDVVMDVQQKYLQWQSTADRFYKLWRTGMRIPEDGKPPAAVGWTDLDSEYSWGRPWLTHPRHLR